MIEEVWQYYHQHGRDLPWRHPAADGSFDVYQILVSELMLQQTQVARVIPKYQSFLEQFPTAGSLAEAPLARVLQAWNGLGYNRRAKYLQQAAQQLANQPAKSLDELKALPGVGYHTAAAILNYAYNQATPFLETNIRTVYIHHYFADRDDVSDKELLPLVEQTMDQAHPREWFWALMDYGSYLKSQRGNLSRYSQHYRKQSRFEGSRRQIRGQVIRLLAEKPANLKTLTSQISDQRLVEVLADLQKEGLITRQRANYRLAS